MPLAHFDVVLLSADQSEVLICFISLFGFASLKRCLSKNSKIFIPKLSFGIISIHFLYFARSSIATQQVSCLGKRQIQQFDGKPTSESSLRASLSSSDCKNRYRVFFCVKNLLDRCLVSTFTSQIFDKTHIYSTSKSISLTSFG